MGPFDALIHLLNFFAPALCVAVLLALFARVFMKNRPVALVWHAHLAINLIVCMVPLMLGLWFFGRDGKMATYAAMVLAGAAAQTWMLRKR